MMRVVGFLAVAQLAVGTAIAFGLLVRELWWLLQGCLEVSRAATSSVAESLRLVRRDRAGRRLRPGPT